MYAKSVSSFKLLGLLFIQRRFNGNRKNSKLKNFYKRTV